VVRFPSDIFAHTSRDCLCSQLLASLPTLPHAPTYLCTPRRQHSTHQHSPGTPRMDNQQPFSFQPGQGGGQHPPPYQPPIQQRGFLPEGWPPVPVSRLICFTCMPSLQTVFDPECGVCISIHLCRYSRVMSPSAGRPSAAINAPAACSAPTAATLLGQSPPPDYFAPGAFFSPPFCEGL